ncbi:MAG: ATP-binding protein [Legionellaceae bacterium]|nr:ATP-binding protein [Legionellaceae bacterium]
MFNELLTSHKVEVTAADQIKLLLNSYNLPMLAIDSEAGVLDCNAHFLDIYDITLEYIQNNNYFDLFNQNELSLPADSIEQLLEKSPNKITFHRVFQKSSLQYYQWTAFPLELGISEPVFIILAHDVTYLLEMAIKEQLLLDSLIDSVPAQIFWKDKSLLYLGCNKGFVKSLGLRDKKQIIGKLDFDLPVDMGDSASFREDDLQVINSKKSNLNIEEVQTLKCGRKRVLSTSKVPLFDDNGEVYGVLGVYRDITDQKKSEQDLKDAILRAEQANYTKSEFIANMSHDIRTPLSGVVGMSQLLVDILVDSEQKQHAKWIHECGVQLLGLLNDILTVVAADNTNDKEEISTEVFSLRQCVDDLIQLERPSTSMKGISLDVHIDNNVPEYLVGDRPALYRILLNLLGNAIKFTSVGSVSIKIKTIKKNSDNIKMQFSVIDTGIGIPDELQSKVFDRFYRANPSYKGVYSGHGIGLHIAKSYVNRLGGDLQFNSKVDSGTTFYFELSFDISEDNNLNVISQDLDLKKQKSVQTLHDNTNLPIILLVEDNYVALKVLESILKLLNLGFVSANDGESALEIATRQNFNLIITDIGLPGISGNELTRKIRDWESMHNKEPIPIIGLTAHVREQIRDECLNSGMNDAYSKPMDLDTMKEIISNFIT